jgi:hypothetical protein
MPARPQPNARLRLATPCAALLAAAALAACGSSSQGQSTREAPGATSSTTPSQQLARVCHVAGLEPPEVRVVGVSCARGRRTVKAWRREPACAPPAGASRSACSVSGLRCLGTVTESGLAVSCAGPGRAISFRGAD